MLCALHCSQPACPALHLPHAAPGSASSDSVCPPATLIPSFSTSCLACTMRASACSVSREFWYQVDSCIAEYCRTSSFTLRSAGARQGAAASVGCHAICYWTAELGGACQLAGVRASIMLLAAGGRLNRRRAVTQPAPTCPSAPGTAPSGCPERRRQWPKARLSASSAVCCY